MSNEKLVKWTMNICNSRSGLKMAIARLCIAALCYVKSHSTYIFPIYHCSCFLENYPVFKPHQLKVLSLQFTSNIHLRLLPMFAQFMHINLSFKRSRLIFWRDHNFMPLLSLGSAPEISLFPRFFWHKQWELNDKLILAASKAPKWLQYGFLHCSERAHPNEVCTMAKGYINYALRKLPNYLGVSTHYF